MTNVKYQITLSIISDDPIAATNALAQIKKLDGILAQPVESNSNTPGYQQFNLDIQPPAQPDKAPLCGVHHFPMKLMHGKRGPFYSCHEKMPDGSWCNYRP